jgi:protein-L-isoaspartate O-methyltransferase
MNRQHLESLSSPAWAQMLETNLLPWLEAVTELGDDVLEIGPGPGLTTDLLRQRAARVTAVEIDPALATALADRLRDTNVEVVHGDASRTGLAGDRFSTATCFAMLHHVPSPELQDQVLA